MDMFFLQHTVKSLNEMNVDRIFVLHCSGLTVDFSDCYSIKNGLVSRRDRLMRNND